MTRKIYFLLILALFILLLAPTALALDTTIRIKSEPFHTVIVKILNPDTGAEMASKYIITPPLNATGEGQVEYSTGLSELSFHIFIKHPITKDVIDEKEFENIKVKSIIFLDLGTENPTSETDNETESNETEDNETIENDNLIDVEVTIDQETENDTEAQETEELTGERSFMQRITGFFVSEGGGSDDGERKGSVWKSFS